MEEYRVYCDVVETLSIATTVKAKSEEEATEIASKLIDSSLTVYTKSDSIDLEVKELTTAILPESILVTKLSGKGEDLLRVIAQQEKTIREL